ncbi:hypothetical protein BDR26DRAFT_939366 [Obelidium mucronatum]|nr:hypothetical protein BDR26DRAFT_939366 [Obelidium mucronatum]
MLSLANLWQSRNLLRATSPSAANINSGSTQQLDHHQQQQPTTPVHKFTAESNKFTLTVETPGFSRDQLTTTVTDDTRQITIEGKNPNSGSRKLIALTVTVPRLGDLGKLNAVLQDGILTIEIPKLERDGRVVEVHQGSNFNVGTSNTAAATTATEAGVAAVFEKQPASPTQQTEKSESVDGYVVA